jgi:hypothetical protein
VLFHVTWDFVDTSEDAIRRNLAYFSQWKPPDGFDFKGFWGFADGSGGVAIVEADSATTLARATAPFTPWLRFNTTPILPVEESAAIAGEAVAARDSGVEATGTASPAVAPGRKLENPGRVADAKQDHADTLWPVRTRCPRSTSVGDPEAGRDPPGHKGVHR